MQLCDLNYGNRPFILIPHPGTALPNTFTGARLVQLGDLGHGKHGSGGLKCFEYAKDFLDGFGARTALVLGNHGGYFAVLGGTARVHRTSAHGRGGRGRGAIYDEMGSSKTYTPRVQGNGVKVLQVYAYTCNVTSLCCLVILSDAHPGVGFLAIADGPPLGLELTPPCNPPPLPCRPGGR